MITLYNTSLSTCSQKARLCLAEKGLDFVDLQISLKDNEQYAAWYLALNPNGVVPTLDHDGLIVTDSSVINEYLDEVFPDPPLIPRDPGKRAHLRAWRQFIDEVPTAAIRVPSFNAYIVPSWGKAAGNDNWGTERLEKAKIRISFYRRLTDDGFPRQDVEDALTKLRLTAERMEKSLQNGDWIMGDTFTVVDIALIPTFVRMEDLGILHLIADLNLVRDWFTRAQARPSFARAYYPGSRMPAAKPEALEGMSAC